MRGCVRRSENRLKSVVSGVLLQVWAWDSEEIEGAREDDEEGGVVHQLGGAMIPVLPVHSQH